MNQEWRYTAKSVTKYDPAFRDSNGRFHKNEWTSFFQVGTVVNGRLISYEEYTEIENRYIAAAKWFFNFYHCTDVKIINLEKPTWFSYKGKNKQELKKTFLSLTENDVVKTENVVQVIQLILREVIWAELFCVADESVAVRFGFDFYMYFNSPTNIIELNATIADFGLFVW